MAWRFHEARVDGKACRVGVRTEAGIPIRAEVYDAPAGKGSAIEIDETGERFVITSVSETQGHHECQIHRRADGPPRAGVPITNTRKADDGEQHQG